ncbi:hypothetical protein HY224_02555 [Candidatus Uhrbacteria bacterium]|nr:hypothetical protein [Candidatus Uhrbacteria bacterium]
MSLNNLKKALHGLKDYPVPMDAGWQSATRALLLEQIGGVKTVSNWEMVKDIFSNGFRRASVSSVVAVVVMMSGAGLVRAASDALPGDNLYTVKRGWENVKYALAIRDQSRVELELKTAQLRVRELSLVVKNKADNGIINEAVNEVHRGFSTVKYRLDTASVDDPAKATEIATAIDKHTDEYAQALKDVKNELDNASDPRLKDEVGKKVNLALISVEQTGLQAISVIVAKKVETNTAPDQAIKNSIVKKLENTRQSLETSKQRVQKFEKQIKANQVSLTPVPANEATINQARVLVEQPKQVLDEAQKSLEKGDLTEAVNKIVEGKEIVDKVEQKIDKAVQEVEPTDKPIEKTPETPTSVKPIPQGKVGLTL